MNMETTIVARPERLTNLADLLRRFERDDMERAVDLPIAMMDAADVPLIGDEPDFAPRSDGAPGTADDAETDVDREHAAFAEWKAEGRHKLYAGGVPTRSWDSVHEDDEDDNPREDDGEDCCVAWEDDASRFSERHAMGFGWDRPIHDPDAEPEHDGDPLDVGEIDHARYLPKPIYGVDQRKGPLNERQAWRAHHAEQMRDPAAVRS